MANSILGVKILEKSIIEEAAMQLINANMASISTMKGCTESEIEQIESAFGINLPTVYKHFLERMGKSAGDFLVGTEYLFPDLLKLRKMAEDLLESCSAQFILHKSDFVFAAHQGYQFLFFRASDSSDPPIFYFLEGEEEPTQVFDHFSEWLLECLSDEITTFKGLERI
jgi:hypothetical protein